MSVSIPLFAYRKMHKFWIHIAVLIKCNRTSVTKYTISLRNHSDWLTGVHFACWLTLPFFGDAVALHSTNLMSKSFLQKKAKIYNESTASLLCDREWKAFGPVLTRSGNEMPFLDRSHYYKDRELFCFGGYFTSFHSKGKSWSRNDLRFYGKEECRQWVVSY